MTTYQAARSSNGDPWSAAFRRPRRLRTVADGFGFTEGPRWHDGALWFVDMHGQVVVRVGPDHAPGEPPEVVARIGDDEPSGLGWLPDGRLLLVSMERGRLLRVEFDGSVVEHADLSGLARGTINDMIVAAGGTAYVGDMGMRLNDPTAEHRPGQVIAVGPDGSVRCAADGLAAPNGHILSADERTLIVAQSSASELTAFDVADDGSLSNRRPFALLSSPARVGRGGRGIPDGCCLDADGAVWYADPFIPAVVRVADGGEVLEAIEFPGQMPVACTLGGEDRRTLFICVASHWRRDAEGPAPSARIVSTVVDVAGAGKP